MAISLKTAHMRVIAYVPRLLVIELRVKTKEIREEGREEVKCPIGVVVSRLCYTQMVLGSSPGLGIFLSLSCEHTYSSHLTGIGITCLGED